SSRTSCGCGRSSRRCRSPRSTGTTSCGSPVGAERSAVAGPEESSVGFVEHAALGQFDVAVPVGAVADAVEAARESLVDDREKALESLEQLGQVAGHERIAEQIDGGDEPVLDEHHLDV